MSARNKEKRLQAGWRRGFTLLEVLVAVALLGMLLVALNVFIFSMGEIWGRSAEQRLFDQHVRAVTRHVEKMLRSASQSPVTLGNTTVAMAAVREVRTPSGGTQTLLTFDLPAGDRLLAWPEQPLPEVVCALGVQSGEGLVLYWHSRLEKDFATQSPRVAVLSPFGTTVSYEYYSTDFKSWRHETAFQKNREGKWRLPDRVTLQFAHGRMSSQTTISLTTPVEGLPAF